jgi:hypothetical protein
LDKKPSAVELQDRNHLCRIDFLNVAMLIHAFGSLKNYTVD